MPMLNGFDASEQLKSANPAIKIIVLTMNEDAEIAAETLRTWASGFLLKKIRRLGTGQSRAGSPAWRKIHHTGAA